MGKEKFFERVKGPMQNYEDWYHLVTTDADQLQVEHSWSYVSPSLSSDSGSHTCTVNEFMESGDVDPSAKVALEQMLAGREAKRGS